MKTFLVLTGLILGVISIQLVSASLIHAYIPDWTTRGQFGDSFGATNALFSGLAFAGLIYTVLLQRNELKLQREELALTRLELSRSAEAQERSERALATQALAAQAAAEISAINNLLAYVNSEITRMSLTQTDLIINREQVMKLSTQRANLINNLNDVYNRSVSSRLGL